MRFVLIFSFSLFVCSLCFGQQPEVKDLKEAPQISLFGQVLPAPKNAPEISRLRYYFFKNDEGKAIAIPLEMTPEQMSQIKSGAQVYYHLKGQLEIRSLSLEGKAAIVTVLKVNDIVPRNLSDLSYRGFVVRENDDGLGAINEPMAQVRFLRNSDRPLIELPDRVATATIFIAGLFAVKEMAPASGSQNSYGQINHGVLLTTSAVFLGSLLLEALEEGERKKQ